MSQTEKPKEDRVKETVEILRSIKGLGISINEPEVIELRGHFRKYIEEGICWAGSINFLRFGRMAEVNLPRRADKMVEVTLRVPRAGGMKT